MVTRPWISPYSSTTSAIDCCSSRKISSSFIAWVDSETYSGSRRVWNSALSPRAMRVASDFSSSTPTTSMSLSRYTGYRENSCSAMMSRLRSSPAWVSSQAMRLRGVIRLSAVRSPRRMTRFIMSRSWASITPASWLSATSIRISSSVTCAASSLPRPSTFSTSWVVLDRSKTKGRASLASQLIGIATRPAMASERVRARRLGTSSPKISVMKVISETARAVPTSRAYAKPGIRPCSQPAIASPIASPPR